MCCLISALFLIGPRAAIVVWWLLEPARWAAAFDTVLWPIVGFLFLPWMTLMFLVVAPGGVEGFDYVWLDHRTGDGPVHLGRRRLHEPRPDADGDRLTRRALYPASPRLSEIRRISKCC